MNQKQAAVGQYDTVRGKNRKGPGERETGMSFTHTVPRHTTPWAGPRDYAIIVFSVLCDVSVTKKRKKVGACTSSLVVAGEEKHETKIMEKSSTILEQETLEKNTKISQNNLPAVRKK